MAQTNTNISTKASGDEFTHIEFNDVNNAINSNATDAESRIGSVEVQNNDIDTRLTTIEATSVPIQAHTTQTQPETASTGALIYNTSEQSIVYFKNGYWYKISDDSMVITALKLTIDTTNIKTGGDPTDVFNLPLISGNNYEFDIDWGDGTTGTVTAWNDSNKNHTYTTGGIYTVLIAGVFEGFSFNLGSESLKLTEIEELGSLTFANSATGAFGGATNLSAIDASKELKTTGVTTFNQFYRDCALLTAVPMMDMTSNDNSHLMFRVCTGLTSLPDFDMGAPTEFKETFFGMSNVTDLSNITVDTSNVQNLQQVFYDNRKLTAIPYLDTTSATSLFGLFRNCHVLTSVGTPDGNHLNTQNVTNFSNTFRDCRVLIEVPPINTQSGTNFERICRGCFDITAFPAVNTINVQNFNEAWIHCNDLADFPEMDFSSGTNFTSAWTNCALTMASVENILKSLVASGVTGKSTSISGGSTVAKTNWTTNADAARDALTNYEILTEPIGNTIHGTTGRGWIITTN
jgi:hypothetical protein